MALVLDAGALVAVERGARAVARQLELAVRARAELRTCTAVIAQVWRDGARQARLAHLLRNVVIVPLAEPDDRRTGELLRRAGTADVVDAHLALLAMPGDVVLTSDPADIEHLLLVRECAADVVAV